MLPPMPSGMSARARAVRAAVEARVADASRRVDALRDENTIVDAALEAAELDRRRAGSLLAGGVAFRAFLWLLPAALLATGSLSLFHRVGGGEPATVVHEVGLVGVVASSVAGASQQSDTATALLLAIGAGFTVYFGMSLVRALRVAFVLAWDLPFGRRPALLRDGVLVSLALLAQAGSSAAASWLRGQAGVAGVLVTVAAALLGSAIWLGVQLLLPHGDAPWTALIPGTVLIYVCLQLLHVATVYYFAGKIESEGHLYGSLGIAATLLLWLYVMARTIVAGGFVNAALWRRRGGGGTSTGA
jgi:membrane protein